MKKQAHLIAALTLAAIALTTGCASWFKNIGDVSIVWKSNLGHEFTLVAYPDGLERVLFKSATTGLLYEVTEEGGFTITAPNGETERVQQVEENPPDQTQVPDPQSQAP